MLAAAHAPSRLIVTRPEPEASRWVRALEEQGQSAQALPLIVIDALPLAPADVPAPGLHSALMFVSGAAVRAFFGQAVTASLRHTSARFWCTGPGTAAALRAAGIADTAIDTPPVSGEQFDSEALWQIVQGQVRAGTRVCIVRGGDAQGQAAGRGWLASTLIDAGAQLDTVVAYRRLAPAFDEAGLARIRAAVQAQDTWLFSSSEAVSHLQAACAAMPDLPWAQCRALATHERIAQAAHRLAFGQVQIVAPLLPHVLAALRKG